MVNVRFWLEYWDGEKVRSQPEDELNADPSILRRPEGREGWVAIQAGGQPEVRLRDELGALFQNLSFESLTAQLAEKQDGYLYRSTTEGKHVTIVALGSLVALYGEHIPAVRYHAADYWPAIFAAGDRYLTLLERAGAPDARHLRPFRDAARRTLDQLGWTATPEPEPRPAPSSPLDVPQAWVRYECFTRRLEPCRAFYRAVLGPAVDHVEFTLSDAAISPPQWLGYLSPPAPANTSEALMDLGGVDIDVTPQRRVWMDPWGALVGETVDPRPGALEVVHHELVTRDVSRAARFYEQLLGWVATAEDGRCKLSRGDRVLGWVRAAAPEEHAHWARFFAVDDLAAAVATAAAAGATVERRDTDRAWLRDPFEGFFGVGQRR